MKKKAATLILFTLFFSVGGFAQVGFFNHQLANSYMEKSALYQNNTHFGIHSRQRNISAGNQVKTFLFSTGVPFRLGEYMTLKASLDIFSENTAGIMKTQGFTLYPTLIRQKGLFNLALGTQVSLVNEGFDFSNFYTDSQILNGVLDISLDAQENMAYTNQWYPGLGFIFSFSRLNPIVNDPSFFVNFSMQNLNQPQIGYLSDLKEKRNISIEASMGKAILLNNRFSLIPNMSYLQWQNNMVWEGGISAKFYFQGNTLQNKAHWTQTSLSLKSNNNLTILTGFKIKNYTLNLSYNLPVGVFKENRQNALSNDIEVSFLFTIPSKKKTRLKPESDSTQAETRIDTLGLVMVKAGNPILGHLTNNPIHKKVDTLEIIAKIEITTELQYQMNQVSVNEQNELKIGQLIEIMLQKPDLKLLILSKPCEGEYDPVDTAYKRANIIKLFMAERGINPFRIIISNVSDTNQPISDPDCKEGIKIIVKEYLKR